MSVPLSRQEVAALVARIETGELIHPGEYGRIVATFEHLQEQSELLAQVAADLQRQVHALRAEGAEVV